MYCEKQDSEKNSWIMMNELSVVCCAQNKKVLSLDKQKGGQRGRLRRTYNISFEIC